MTDIASDVFPDTRLQELLAKVEDARELDNWWDADPSVSWEMEPGESMFGTLAGIYIDAGWEKCYHREGARFHWNIKLRNPASWRAFQDAIHDAVDNGGVSNESRLEELARGITDFDIERWWQDYTLDYVRYERGIKEATVYGCGRMGGYANCPNLENDPEEFLRLGQWLAREHALYDSPEYSRGIVEMALEQYREEKTKELASPRIERIEA